MSTWVRTVQDSTDYASGNILLASIPRGDTLLRVHFGWGFYGGTSTTVSYADVASNIQVMGLVTTVGNGTESVPNARTASSDADPPSQRWVYWEARAPKLAAIDGSGELVAWQDSGAQEPVDTKGQVSAKTIPSGDTLNLWASWAAVGGWDSSGTAVLWLYASILYQPST